MANEKMLDELVRKLKAAVGANLRSVVLYGSAASGEFHEKFSDLNVICLFDRLDGSELEKISPVSAWWAKKGYPAPLIFALDELRNSADIFPIEMLDIKANRRVLYGEDVFAALEVPMRLHRVAVERELRINLIRLRQAFLAGKPDAKRIMHLMTSSVTSFVALFRHALLALGEELPKGTRQVTDRLAERLGFDAAPFHAVWDVRERKRKESDVEARTTFRGYVESIQRVVDEMDQRLAEPQGVKE